MRLVRSISFVFVIALVALTIQDSFAQNISQKITKSLKLIEFGNPKQALVELQSLAAANPKDADVLGAVAIAKLSVGKPTSEIEKDLESAYDMDRKSIYVRIARGDLFGKEGKLEDAVKEFRQALKIDKNNIGAYLALARFYLANDSLKAAEVTLYQAQAVSADDVRPYLGLAELYEKQKIPALAISQYESAQKIDPMDISVHAKLAGLYYRDRKYDESVSEWLKASKIDSSYSRAYYEIALIYFRSEQYPSAATYAEKYVKLAPDDLDGNWLLAQSLSETNQYQKALPYLEKAAKDDSLKNFVQLYLARGYFFSKEFPKANETFASAKNLGPYDLYYWGYSLFSSSDTAGAIAKWRESFVGDSIRKTDDKIKVYQQIVSLLSAQKKWGEAARTYVDMNSVSFSVDNLVKAGQLYTFGQMPDSAKMVFTEAIQKDPKSVGATIGLADVAMQDQTTAKDAENLLEQAATLATTKTLQESVGEAYARLGIKYYTYKNFDRSVQMLETQKAQKFLSASSPYLINVYKVLAAGYLQTKKFEKAEENYKKALLINPKDDDAKKGLDFLKTQKSKK